MRKFWTEKEDYFLKEYYNKESKEFIVNNLNRTWYAIRSRAKKLKIKRDKSASLSNIKYFDKWSEEMAYILGFIFADGCVIDRSESTGDKVFSLGLSKADDKHLKLIKNQLAPKKKTWNYHKNEHEVCYFRIGSKYLCNRLIELGVVHRKSKIVRFPDISEKYVSHFIRGYFDGDGSFGVYKKSNEPKTIFCSGSKCFLESINKQISRKCNISLKNITYSKNANAYYLNYHTNEAIKVCDWMYKDCGNMKLERKYNKYKNFVLNRIN